MAPRALIYAPEALADLGAAAAWLTQPRSGPAAWRRLEAVWAAIERLREQPCLHPVLDHPGVRELPCPSGWRAFYEVEPDTGRNDDAGDVVVLRVYAPGQDRRGFRPS